MKVVLDHLLWCL